MKTDKAGSSMISVSINSSGKNNGNNGNNGKVRCTVTTVRCTVWTAGPTVAATVVGRYADKMTTIRVSVTPTIR